MHGSYTHRVTCNLHPEQYFRLLQVARKFNTRISPFLREAALSYIDKRSLLPPALQQQLRGIVAEVRRVGTNLNQIAARANTYQRVTHDDLRKAGKLVVMLERQVLVLHHALETLPCGPEVHEPEEQ